MRLRVYASERLAQVLFIAKQWEEGKQKWCAIAMSHDRRCGSATAATFTHYVFLLICCGGGGLTFNSSDAHCLLLRPGTRLETHNCVAHNARIEFVFGLCALLKLISMFSIHSQIWILIRCEWRNDYLFSSFLEWYLTQCDKWLLVLLLCHSITLHNNRIIVAAASKPLYAKCFQWVSNKRKNHCRRCRARGTASTTFAVTTHVMYTYREWMHETTLKCQKYLKLFNDSPQCDRPLTIALTY